MRKQIAAANWKMNLTLTEGEQLLDQLLVNTYDLNANRQMVFAVPAPYLAMANEKVKKTRACSCCSPELLQ